MDAKYKGIFVQKFGGPEVLTVSESQIPVAGPNQVLVKIRSAGINPVETYQRSGSYTPSPVLPWVPGKDAAGEVVQAGENAAHLVGQRVWLSSSLTGTYAQYAIAPADGVHPLPSSHSFHDGSALWVNYATAYHAVHHIGQVKPNETVLVHGGTGGVGLASIYWLKQINGVKILATGGSPNGRDVLKQAGVHHTFDHTEKGYTKSISDLTNGKVDVILEMLANVNLNEDLQLLNIGGRVCIIGNRGTIDNFNPRALMAKRSAVKGVMLFHLTPEEKKEIINAIDSGLQNQSLKPHITHIYPLADAPKAHEDVMKSHLGKLVIDPWL